MEQIVIAVISGIVAIVVAAIGVVAKRNSKAISDLQADGIEAAGTAKTGRINEKQLIETLNNTVLQQQDQINILRGIVDEQRVLLEAKDVQIEDLTKRVSKLEQLTIEQALIIRDLEKSGRVIKRAPKHVEGGEAQSHD